MKKILCQIIILSLTFSGCAWMPLTNRLYKNTDNNFSSYQEETHSFLISQDNKQLVVIGKQHHYIFEADDTLQYVLTSPAKPLFQAVFDNFEVADDQSSVSDSYTLSVSAQDISVDIQNQLFSKGFINNADRASSPISHPILIFHGSIKGNRYLADKFQTPNPISFNQTYVIQIHEKIGEPDSASARRALLTPLTIAADGIILIGLLPLLPLAIPAAASH